LSVQAEYLAHRDALVRKWLLSAVAAIFSKSKLEKFEGCLVLQGYQGNGKTSWFKALAPAELEAVLEGHILDPGNKDSVFTVTAHWIGELGELDSTFSRGSCRIR
jgi:putative DNA primase/helicase